MSSYARYTSLVGSQGGSGITSINGDTTAAQNIIGGQDINVSSGGGTTTVASTSQWKDPVANMAALPAVGNASGDVRVTKDTGIIWEWNGSSWITPAEGLPPLTNSHIFVGNASNIATDVAMSGNIAISNTGATTIQSGVIVDSMVNSAAAIAGTKISPNFGSQFVQTSGNMEGAAFIPGSTTIPTDGIYAVSPHGIAFAVNSALAWEMDGTGNFLANANVVIGNINANSEVTLRSGSSGGGGTIKLYGESFPVKPRNIEFLSNSGVVASYVQSTGKWTFTGDMSVSGNLTSSLTSGDIFVGNGSNISAPVAVSGDATLANTGVLTLNTVSIAKGGTGQTTALAGFDALSPMTTAGDILYENATPVAARLPIGATGKVLTVAGGLPSWATATATAPNVSYTPTTSADWTTTPTTVQQGLDDIALSKFTSTFVFQPGGVASHNRYTDWATMMKDVNLCNGFKVIQISDSVVSPAVIPLAGMPVTGWDLGGTILKGSTTGNTVICDIQDGAFFKNLSGISDNLAIESTSNTTPVLTVNNGTQYEVYVDRLASVNSTGTAPFFQVDGGTEFILLILSGGNIQGSSNGTVNVINNSSFVAYLEEAAGVNSNSLSDDGTGTAIFFVAANSATFSLTQPDFTGSLGPLLLTDSSLDGFTSSTGLTSTNAQAAIDEVNAKFSSFSGTVALAKLTPVTGVNGHLTVVNGVITAYVAPT